MKFTEARRVLKARRIIGKAFGIKAAALGGRALRFELVGSDVAVAVVAQKEGQGKRLPAIRVARELPGLRCKRLLADSRDGFECYADVLGHLDALHAKYGS